MLHVELQEVFVEAGALRLIPGGRFGEHRCGGHGILVAHKVADEVAVGLFSAHNEGLLTFVASDQIRNPFEARQGVVGGNTVAASDAFQQGGCDHGTRHKGVIGHAALGLVLVQHIIDQYGSGLVPIQ